MIELRYDHWLRYKRRHSRDPKEPVELAEVSDFDVLGQACFEIIDQWQCSCHNGTIINMHQHNNQRSADMPIKDCLVHLTMQKPQDLDKGFEKMLVPSLPRLFQTVKHLEEPTDFGS